MALPYRVTFLSTGKPCISLATTCRVFGSHGAPKDAVLKRGPTPGTIFGAPRRPVWEERQRHQAVNLQGADALSVTHVLRRCFYNACASRSSNSDCPAVASLRALPCGDIHFDAIRWHGARFTSVSIGFRCAGYFSAEVSAIKHNVRLARSSIVRNCSISFATRGSSIESTAFISTPQF